MNNKLTLNLIPKSSFYRNCRSLIPLKDWDRIRKSIYQQANYTCEICRATKETYSNKKGWLHCNEMWEFLPRKDNRGIQKLVKLEAICWLCHYAKHQGYATMIGMYDACRQHMKKVNGWTWEELEEHETEQWNLWAKRSEMEWKINLSYLDEKMEK